MNRFFLSVAFCLSLLGLLSFVLVRSSRAREDVIQAMLDMPAPPPPNPLSPPLAGVRPEKFYDKKNPPPDDAPLEDLLDYWKYQNTRVNEFGYSPKPTEKVIERLIGEIDKDPKLIGEYVNLFADSKRGVEFAKHVYDQMPEDAGEEGELLRDSLGGWLTTNSSYFSEGLAASAGQLHEENGYVTNNRELIALSRVDWERARPIVDRAYADASQPIGQTSARWALYKHAIQEDSIGDIDRYRRELMDIVENKGLPAGHRDLALDALLTEKEWSGRDDWYISLFNDETLLDLGTYTGLTTMMLWAPDDRFIPRMLDLLKSDNLSVRTAAARNLTVVISADKPEVVQALLPWLQDPKWARDVQESRSKIVHALQTLKLPESVPGLIAALDEQKTEKVPDYLPMSNSNAAYDYYAATNMANRAANAMRYATNSANAAANVKMREVTSYPLRSAAIEALGNQGDPRAAQPLKRVFNQVEDYEKSSVVTAIMKCNGFTVAEQANALEAFAKEQVAERNYLQDQELIVPPGSPNSNVNAVEFNSRAFSNANSVGIRREIFTYTEDSPFSYTNSAANAAYTGFRTDFTFLLGSSVAVQRDVSEELASAVIRRIGALETTDPETAAALRSIITNWRGKAVNLFLLNDVKLDRATLEAVVRLLATRRELRETQSSDVSDIRSGTPTAAAVAACVLETEADYAGILDGKSDEARKALFACARLIRAKLPIQIVGRYLQGPDKQLALAAERYLESEDSPEARRLVLSVHPNEAKILGATTSFRARSEITTLQGTMQDLFTSVVPNFDTLGDFLYYPFTFNEFDTDEKRLQKEVLSTPELVGLYVYGDAFVRIYKDKAVYSRKEDDSRYRERTLEKEEFENLKNYLQRQRADELPPFLSCSAECEAKELLMLSRAGGRRVFMRSTTKPDFFSGLERILDDMGQRPGRLKYWLEKDVPGLEINFANDRYSAESVWTNGTELRVLVADRTREKEIAREIRIREQNGEPLGDAEPSWNEAEKRKYDHYSWRRVAGGELGDAVSQPVEVPFIPAADDLTPPSNQESWKAHGPNFELRGSSDGLFKVIAGRVVRIASGSFGPPVVSSSGRWAIATRYEPDGGPARMMRINLLTNRLTAIASDEFANMNPIAYVASVNRFLVGYRSGDSEFEEVRATKDDGGGTYYWVTPETGSFEETFSAELRPIGQQRYRPLQPTARPFEFWAAIPDIETGETSFGIYNSRTFFMRPLLKLPRIRFNSQAMWVDEPAMRVYFVYEGHVLSVPFKK